MPLCGKTFGGDQMTAEARSRVTPSPSSVRRTRNCKRPSTGRHRHEHGESQGDNCPLTTRRAHNSECLISQGRRRMSTLKHLDGSGHRLPAEIRPRHEPGRAALTIHTNELAHKGNATSYCIRRFGAVPYTDRPHH
jgi:hypothetical protein